MPQLILMFPQNKCAFMAELFWMLVNVSEFSEFNKIQQFQQIH